MELNIELDYFGARYYNSDISVWLSVDPLADKYPNTSPFLYVENNPIMFIDPNGKIKNPFKSKQRLQAEVYAEKVGGEVRKLGYRNFEVSHTKRSEISKDDYELYKGNNPKNRKIYMTELIYTQFSNVEEGAKKLNSIGIDFDKIRNSSWSFGRTLGYDLRQMEFSDTYKSINHLMAKSIANIVPLTSLGKILTQKNLSGKKLSAFDNILCIFDLFTAGRSSAVRKNIDWIDISNLITNITSTFIEHFVSEKENNEKTEN